jgi:hypothetical protein
LLTAQPTAFFDRRCVSRGGTGCYPRRLQFILVIDQRHAGLSFRRRVYHHSISLEGPDGQIDGNLRWCLRMNCPRASLFIQTMWCISAGWRFPGSSDHSCRPLGARTFRISSAQVLSTHLEAISAKKEWRLVAGIERSQGITALDAEAFALYREH